MSMSDELVFAVEDGIATIRLNRPERLNAFTQEMLEAWAGAIETAKRDAAIRVVVLTGTGRGFCSGGDVRRMGERHREGESAFERKTAVHERIHRIPRLLEELDKPYVVAINGIATGAGLDMALMGDIRFAAESARMAETYIRVGLIAGDGGTWFLPRLVGTAKALELLWTGEFVDAAEALRIGLVNKVLPDAELMPYTYEFARKLAAQPALTLRLMKRAVYHGMRMDLRGALDMVSSHLGVISTTNDHREAVAAFNEKRTAKFTDS
jgi:enoyl-CoA hydratase/carnithine racemase